MERPFSKADIRRFGDAVPPEGPILAVGVADLSEKEAVLAAQPGAFFTIPHFDSYAAVLIQLKNVSRRYCEKRSLTAGSPARRPASWTSTSGAERGMSARGGPSDLLSDPMSDPFERLVP